MIFCGLTNTNTSQRITFSFSLMLFQFNQEVHSKGQGERSVYHATILLHCHLQFLPVIQASCIISSRYS